MAQTKRDLTELNKLERYLKEHGIKYDRIDNENEYDALGYFLTLERRQIIVPSNTEERKWDAICHYGSYGGDQGLLEIMGDIVDVKEDGDSVVGFLTAADVIERIERKAKNDTGA